jgi:hypothetical protein
LIQIKNQDQLDKVFGKKFTKHQNNIREKGKRTHAIEGLDQFPRQPIWIEGEDDLPNMIQEEGGAQSRRLAITLCTWLRVLSYNTTISVSLHLPDINTYIWHHYKNSIKAAHSQRHLSPKKSRNTKPKMDFFVGLVLGDTHLAFKLGIVDSSYCCGDLWGDETNMALPVRNPGRAESVKGKSAK